MSDLYLLDVTAYFVKYLYIHFHKNLVSLQS